jgi:hypothetical protein
VWDIAFTQAVMMVRRIGIFIICVVVLWCIFVVRAMLVSQSKLLAQLLFLIVSS